ncbi:MAG: class 1 fructose-bisphosphatase [Paracoccus sp. (in: a-proteobacteria)]|nr:class 1 fructose-bisphosphatase [Paracoccus sp. (in: a-proteobacteria)]
MPAMIDDPEIPARIAPVLQALCGVGAALSARIARAGLDEKLGESVGTNLGGDGQKALDVIADEAFMAALRGTGVRDYASEEQDSIVTLDPDGDLALAIDPLDGSSNIDVNISIGTIFSILPAGATGMDSFLGRVPDQIAAGYIIYGPQTALVLSWGQGTRRYVLDRDGGAFRLVEPAVRIPAQSTEFAINTSNYRHWPLPIRAYIDDCVAGAEGVRGQNFNMRWVASLVAETHRILTRGGIFLYPRDSRKGYEAGRLRLLYECAPIAMLVEQAGGMATDGQAPILSLAATGLHQRTPLVFGSADKVARVTAYHDLPAAETAALFHERGLFRS